MATAILDAIETQSRYSWSGCQLGRLKVVTTQPAVAAVRFTLDQGIASYLARVSLRPGARVLTCGFPNSRRWHSQRRCQTGSAQGLLPLNPKAEVWVSEAMRHARHTVFWRNAAFIQ